MIYEVFLKLKLLFFEEIDDIVLHLLIHLYFLLYPFLESKLTHLNGYGLIQFLCEIVSELLDHYCGLVRLLNRFRQTLLGGSDACEYLASHTVYEFLLVLVDDEGHGHGVHAVVV